VHGGNELVFVKTGPGLTVGEVMASRPLGVHRGLVGNIPIRWHYHPASWLFEGSEEVVNHTNVSKESMNFRDSSPSKPLGIAGTDTEASPHAETSHNGQRNRRNGPNNQAWPGRNQEPALPGLGPSPPSTQYSPPLESHAQPERRQLAQGLPRVLDLAITE